MPPMATTHTHDILDPTAGQPATLVEYSQALNRLSDEITLLRQRLAGAVPLDEALEYRQRVEISESDADRLAFAAANIGRARTPEAMAVAIELLRQACVQHDVALQARPPQRIDHHGLVGSTR